MNAPITQQKLIDGALDLKTIDDFVHLPANTAVTRRLAHATQSLDYYLEYLQGLEQVFSNPTGSVTVNGVERKTITQAVSDALASQAYKGDTGDAAIISAITANTLSPGTSATATMGGTPGNRTIALGIPRGDKGATGTIAAVTVKTGAAGSNASVVLTGAPEDRSIEFTVPRGDKGEAATIDTITATTLSPGAAATATMGGTPGNRTIALGIPRGDKGEQGPAVPITSELGQSTTQAVSQKLLTDTLTTRFNDIGEQGKIGFGMGITNKLHQGLSQMQGTAIKGHQNWGNYQYSDGSIMGYVPAFYYRWGHADSPRFTKYGVNALDVKSIHDFEGVDAAAEAGYALHRAFYDNNNIMDGFFVDKYQASNNGGIASSIKNGNPLSASNINNPYSGLTGTPANTAAGAIDAVKTRGANFFVTTIFIQRALSLLSMAHAQAATSSAACAWYDASGVNNFPKGNNNNALRDVNDTTVTYAGTGYLNAGKTGSAKPFAKTTHNGQDSGIADLNGNINEVALGLTQSAGNFYVLKTTAKASALTSGATLDSDAWGTAALAKNYESLGASFGEMTGEIRNFSVGSTTKQVFSSATSGLPWSASCASIPQLGGADGTNIFGNDRFYDNRIEDMCPSVGGSWTTSAPAGVWYMTLNSSRTHGNSGVGVRAALYPV